MGEAGGSSAGSGASAAGSSAGSGASEGAATAEAGKAVSSETKAGDATDETKETKVGETAKVGAVVDDKPITVQEVKDKSTIDKAHIEGEKEVKKHKYSDRLSKAFPDKKFESDDEYEVAHEDYVKDLEGYKERGTVANQKLIALFEAEPQIADVVSAMINGATLRSALARHIGVEDLAPEEGDPDYAEWDKNSKERLARLEKTNQFNKEFNENVKFSEQSIKDFAEENKLEPEEAEKILTEFDDMLKDIYRGRITKETLTKIMRAVKHDEAVKEAKEEGEIKGRNETIKAEVEKEDKKEGDGIPALKKSGDTIEEAPEKPEQAKIIDRIVGAGQKRSHF